MAIPQRSTAHFPKEKRAIAVRFDNHHRTRLLTYRPRDAETKEARLLGLGKWFSKAGVQEGDPICIIVGDPEEGVYRIALQRQILAEDEAAARVELKTAQTDSIAQEALRALVRLTKKRPAQVAMEEMRRIAEATRCRPRPRTPISVSTRSESVPPGLRLLLREVHNGKCQLCSFTFAKRDGEPYFEIHHLDPKRGHHPHNLLVVCPNCHAQFEHAILSECVWAGNWLISITINGKRIAIHQPLASGATLRTMLGIMILLAAHFGPIMITSRYH